MRVFSGLGMTIHLRSGQSPFDQPTSSGVANGTELLLVQPVSRLAIVKSGLVPVRVIMPSFPVDGTDHTVRTAPGHAYVTAGH